MHALIAEPHQVHPRPPQKWS